MDVEFVCFPNACVGLLQAFFLCLYGSSCDGLVTSAGCFPASCTNTAGIDSSFTLHPDKELAVINRENK